MKRLIVLLGFLCSAASAQDYDGASLRSPSYYGFSGLSFIPTAQVQQPNALSLAYLAKPVAGKDLTLEPFSVAVGYGTRIDGLELTATNTPFYASKRLLQGVDVATGLPSFEQPLPIFPAIKYQVMPMTPQSGLVAMAVGFALPYGAYYVVDKYITNRAFDVTIHTGVGTKLTTYHAFLGLTLTFGDRRGTINRDFPLELLLEGSWGGSLKQLDEKEEAFLAMSFRFAWTKSLFIKTTFRLDSQPLFDRDELISDGPTRRVGIGLSYTLDRLSGK